MLQVTKTTLLLVFIALLASCGPEPLTVQDLGKDHPMVGTQAPTFSLPVLEVEGDHAEGAELSLESLRGKTVVLDFWATWCVPCHFQIPVLNGIAKDYATRDVVVLGVAVDAEGWKIVAPFVAQEGFEYPVLLGDEQLAKTFGAPGFPYSMIIDPQGQIVSIHMGITGNAAYGKHLPK